MNVDDAADILRRLDIAKGFVPNETAGEFEARVGLFAEQYEAIPGEWAANWVRSRVSKGETPTPAELASAWWAEAKSRFDLWVDRNYMPAPPDGLEAGTPAWKRWEMEARRAIITGAETREEVEQVADRAIGVTRARAQIGSGRGAKAKAEVLAAIAAYQEEQARLHAALLADIAGGAR